ncbi:transporter substrate-binding protein [Rhodovulum steppense]|uniref:Amino acid/amide ABC transporter substrate-binding protein (HAAT family) n=1 Tax=Rhodovulum steppense TaxID=540251 RepID=A0A4R1Z0Q0_9RHOB|nr:transporter substrate-binding protein [Rhodovulum steppense]TCM87097.1 amino acid/amide ABC transporter substrate-binding protein (HAAT family) [Rhodovulum steppense]
MATARIGLLFSTTGPYSALGRSALDGALMAVAEVNARNGLTLVPVCADPRGVPADYERLAAELLGEGALRHIVGGITSWSRKDMIPVMERHGALLWYPCPYEGFECNDHVVYLGACPNQHLVPLIDHVLRKGHRRAFLVGSNYVWGWETLRVAREWVSAGQGGEVTGERYLPLGDTACGHLIEEIAAQQPDLIVNSLIGPSSHAFMQALSRLDLPGGRPLVVSANQTEADLDALGPAADGMLSMGAWFETLDDLTTVAFRNRIAAHYGAEYRASCNFATAYTAVHLLARGLERAGRDDPRAVFAAVAGSPEDTVLGPVTIDPVTRHTSLIPRLAMAEAGRFRIVDDPMIAVTPDPYLARVSGPVPPHATPRLRIVS